jgi:hypothetical protein
MSKEGWYDIPHQGDQFADPFGNAQLNPFGGAKTVFVSGHIARTAPNGAFYVKLDKPVENPDLVEKGRLPREAMSPDTYGEIALGFNPSNLCVANKSYVRPYRGEPMSSIGMSVGAPVMIVWSKDIDVSPKVVVEEREHRGPAFFQRLMHWFEKPSI